MWPNIYDFTYILFWWILSKKLRKFNNEISIESPVLTIFKRLGISTRTITAQELQNKEILSKDNEVQLAYKNFGNEKDVGTASLSFEELNTKKWQRRLKVYDKLLRKYVGKTIDKNEAEERW